MIQTDFVGSQRAPHPRAFSRQTPHILQERRPYGIEHLVFLAYGERHLHEI